jgi:hypothetical protein
MSESIAQHEQNVSPREASVNLLRNIALAHRKLTNLLNRANGVK